MAELPICSGIATFISFLTPDKDVKVEEPVKFIATKDATDVIIRNQAIISAKLFPVVCNANKVAKRATPVKNPFNANGLPGM